jgi:hypothetical protein
MRILLLRCLPLLLAASPASLPTAAAAEMDPLFASPAVLELTLSGPFIQIDNERDKDKEYTAALTYLTEDGTRVELDVGLQVRGNYRLRKNVCRHSQLWLDFRTRDAAGTLFENQDKVKLAVQCRSSDAYRAALVREFQAYRFFAQLSGLSFATRLARITYHDPAYPRRDRTELGFFIEHQERLAARLDLQDVELNRIAETEVDGTQGSLVAMFMYMIANTDYSLVIGEDGDECCHNAKLLRTPGGFYAPIPYDFDMSGYVDAPYASPSPQLQQRSIRQRIYRGYCAFNELLDTTVARFNLQRDALNGIMEDTTHISAGQAARSREYIDGFYDVINDPAEVSAEILRRCR